MAADIDGLRDKLAEVMHDEVCDCGDAVHWRTSRHYCDALMPVINRHTAERVAEALASAEARAGAALARHHDGTWPCLDCVESNRND